MNTFSLSKISRSWLPVVLKSTMVFPLAAQTSDWYVFILFISIVCIVLINMLCTSIPLPGRNKLYQYIYDVFYDVVLQVFFSILQDSKQRNIINIGSFHPTGIPTISICHGSCLIRSLPTRGELLRRHQDASLNRLDQAASQTPLVSRCAVVFSCRNLVESNDVKLHECFQK